MVNPYPKHTQTSNRIPGPFFIVLSGKKQVGKDTAVKMMVQALEKENKKVVVTAFAEPLKRMCIDILGLSPEGVYGTDEEKNALSAIQWDGFPANIREKYGVLQAGKWSTQSGPRSGSMTNREVLQVMGTDIFRAISNDVWANAPFNRDWKDTDVVLLTDCRFPNEKWATERNNGVIIRLERNTGFSDNHPSETALDGYQFDISYHNNGTLEELEKFVMSVLEQKGLINGR